MGRVIFIFCISACSAALAFFPSSSSMAVTGHGTEWIRGFGYGMINGFYSASATPDGGAVLGGIGHDPGIPFNDDSGNIGWILKIGSNGTSQWEREIDLPGMEIALAVASAPDGGYLAGGLNYPPEWSLFGENGEVSLPAWAARLDGDGKMKWVRIISGPEDGSSLLLALEENGGGIKAVGISASPSAGTGCSGEKGFVIWRISPDGREVKMTCPGVTVTSDDLYGAALLPEGKVGIAYSLDGKARVALISEDDSLEWNSEVGIGTFRSVVPAPDGGLIAAGESLDGRPRIVAVDPEGGLAWETDMSGVEDGGITRIVQARDGYFAAGLGRPAADGEDRFRHDMLAVRTDLAGRILWAASAGGTDYEETNAAACFSDGACAAFGHSDSIDGDLSAIAGARKDASDGLREAWGVKFQK